MNIENVTKTKDGYEVEILKVGNSIVCGIIKNLISGWILAKWDVNGKLLFLERTDTKSDGWLGDLDLDLISTEKNQ